MTTPKQSGEPKVHLRPLREDDVELLQLGLYLMVAWNPDRGLPPEERLVAHPELARYHRDWGRPGDLGLVAEIEGEFAGVAFCRLFTEDDHGHGYVDPETPELGVAVVEGHRGAGVGTVLMEELADRARAAGFVTLSLSVDLANPARSLYRRLGYREVHRDEGGVRMVLSLAD